MGASADPPHQHHPQTLSVVLQSCACMQAGCVTPGEPGSFVKGDEIIVVGGGSTLCASLSVPAALNVAAQI